VFTPQELIEKLIPLIPRPRCHLVRYHGILGPAAKDRDKVVPTPPALPAPDAASVEAAAADKAGEVNPARSISPRYQESADCHGRPSETRVHDRRADMPKCQGRMKILAAITKPEAIRKILDHLGIPSEAPRRTAARPPPQPSFQARPTSPRSTTLTRPAPSGDEADPRKRGQG